MRVTATLSITSDGEADLSEINDMPVGDSEPDDDKPMPASDLPDLNAAERDIYQ